MTSTHITCFANVKTHVFHLTQQHSEVAGLTVVEEVRRGIVEALDRYKTEAKKRFNGITQLNDMFAFFNSHELLQNKNHETCLNGLKSILEDEFDFSKLIVETDRFKRLVRSSSTTFERSATAIDVSQWLTKR